ncbi:MAG: heme ABC exporter ATP-binding protein CcmA [Deltaproteobacteria bacterium]|nr:heme ABC exporter ATP-binding protein CcmA [Deltaproteobacteria bacterium]
MNKPVKADPMIEARSLVKKYGFRTVLRKLDLSLEKGDFLTLFGPNGAGKTTLIQILCSLTYPTSGEVTLAGYDTREDREELRKIIGVISHHTYLYHHLTAFENLRFYGRMYGVAGLKQRIEELLELVGLTPFANESVHTFSRGMEQRLSVARAIIHDPEVLFLDEPFTGLDQHGAEDFMELLRNFRSQGKTVLMASHDLERGLDLCTHAAILSSGTLVFQKDRSQFPPEGFRQIYFENPQIRTSSISVA